MVIAEKGLVVVERHLDLRARDQQRPDYLKLNPNGYVPTLVHNGRAIIESAIICEYLDDMFPAASLRPADPVDKARMRTWTRRPDDGLHRACASLANATAFRLQWLERPTPDVEAMLVQTPDPIRRNWRREMIERGIDSPFFATAVWTYRALLDDMETQLIERPWLAGQTCTLADIGVIPYLNRAAELQLQAMWERSHPRVTAWLERIRNRPSYQIAFGSYPYPSHCDLMAREGRKAWPMVEALLAAA